MLIHITATATATATANTHQSSPCGSYSNSIDTRMPWLVFSQLVASAPGSCRCPHVSQTGVSPRPGCGLPQACGLLRIRIVV